MDLLAGQRGANLRRLLLPDVEIQIDVENISNEVGSVKNVSSQFFVFLSTPVYLRSCGFG
jgi:hypothetical protein